MTTNAEWLSYVAKSIDRYGSCRLEPRDADRLRSIAESLADSVEAALEAIPVGARTTTACPCCKEQVLACNIEPLADRCVHCEADDAKRKLREAWELIEPLRWQVKSLRSALDALVEQVEIDGALLHSEQCGCDLCEAIHAARRAIKETTAALSVPERKGEA